MEMLWDCSKCLRLRKKTKKKTKTRKSSTDNYEKRLKLSVNGASLFSRLRSQGYCIKREQVIAIFTVNSDAEAIFAVRKIEHFTIFTENGNLSSAIIDN